MASNVVKGVVQQLQEFGETRRGWLGVKIQDVSSDIAESLGLPAEGGAMVTDVPAGPLRTQASRRATSSASFAGGPVKDTRDLVRRRGRAGGNAVDVTVLRDGKPVTLKVTLGRRELADADGTGQQGGNGTAGHAGAGPGNGRWRR